jgi:hypothetical protein
MSIIIKSQLKDYSVEIIDTFDFLSTLISDPNAFFVVDKKFMIYTEIQI